MKQSIFIILMLSFCSGNFSSCKKSKCNATAPTTVASSSEIDVLKNYLSSNGITATEHSNGFFYNIVKAGSSSKPNLCSNVSVQYVGKFLNGNVFDSSTLTTTFALSNLIAGWQIGIPLIGSEGEINLYLPPSLAYGVNGSSSIPTNSTLIFNIKLIAFQKGS